MTPNPLWWFSWVEKFRLCPFNMFNIWCTTQVSIREVDCFHSTFMAISMSEDIKIQKYSVIVSDYMFVFFLFVCNRLKLTMYALIFQLILRVFTFTFTFLILLILQQQVELQQVIVWHIKVGLFHIIIYIILSYINLTVSLLCQKSILLFLIMQSWQLASAISNAEVNAVVK